MPFSFIEFGLILSCITQADVFTLQSLCKGEVPGYDWDVSLLFVSVTLNRIGRSFMNTDEGEM